MSTLLLQTLFEQVVEEHTADGEDMVAEVPYVVAAVEAPYTLAAEVAEVEAAVVVAVAALAAEPAEVEAQR